MRETTIGGESRKIDVNAFTTIVYERAFDGAHKLHEDVNTFMGASMGQLDVLPMDALLRLEYALERSVVPGLFPDFDAWLRAFPKEALDQEAMKGGDGWANTLADELLATFFPSLARQVVGAEPGQAGGEAAERA